MNSSMAVYWNKCSSEAAIQRRGNTFTYEKMLPWMERCQNACRKNMLRDFRDAGMAFLCSFSYHMALGRFSICSQETPVFSWSWFGETRKIGMLELASVCVEFPVLGGPIRPVDQITPAVNLANTTSSLERQAAERPSS